MILSFIKMLFVDVFFGAMFYLWQTEGVEQAGNVFMFMVWFCGIAGLFLIFVNPTAKNYRPKIPGHELVSGMFSFAFLFATAWAGSFVAAALYAIAAISIRVHQSECKKLAMVDK